jgi:uncharacterized protein (DUF2141 family)
MKFLVAILASAVLFISNTINAQEKITITASVDNVTSNKGIVGFSLYNKATFMAEPLQSKQSKIIEGKSIAVFENVNAGEYAIICLHDLNENGIMDFSAQGRPEEDYGASNNTLGFGYPQFDKAKFIVTDKNLKLNIRF